MASITGYGSKHSHEFTLNVNETGTSVSDNTSTISFSFTLYKASYSWSQWDNITYSININGTTYSGTIPNYSAGSTLTIRSGNQTVTHDSDGSKSISFSFSVTDSTGQTYTCGNASASGSMTLTTIPRYANLTSLSVKSRTVNSITLSYTTDKAAWLFVNLNNGEGYLNGGEPFKSNTTSGEFTIYYKDRASTKKLDPNTTYTITVLCRALNRDSELDTSKNISATTYDIAKISTLNNFEHGSNTSVAITNPGSISSLSLVMKISDTQILSRTVTAGSNTITFSDTELDNLYKKYGSSSSLTATFTLTGSGYTNSKTCTVTLKGNQKTARTNVSNSWKRGKVWTNISGSWKRAVIWINVNGTWKRGI